MIAFSLQPFMPVICSYRKRTGAKRCSMEAFSRGMPHCWRKSLVPFIAPEYRLATSTYSASSSMGISVRHRQHQSIFMPVF